MKVFMLRLIGVLVLTGSLSVLLTRQTGNNDASDPLGALLKEDSAATMAMAAYPDTIRKAALRVCSYPEGILKIEELQNSSQRSFRNLVTPLPKEEQERIWNIVRYKGLAEKLVQGKKKSSEELESIAANYPEEVRADAVKSGSENYSTLVKIVSLNRGTDSSFNKLIAGFPAGVQASYRTIVNYPELIELLGGSMRMAVKAGDLQKNYPEKLNRQLDSLNIGLARQKVKETEDWKNGLEKDPVAKSEFLDATKDYEADHHVSEQNTIVNETVVVNYVCYPYPYWYGYPSWYMYPYWYPYPYWYACGYYYGPYGIVYIGYPTPYYTYWYFYHYPHHYHYCHFSDYYIDHYYGHRRTPSSSDRVVENWVRTEETRTSTAFFTKNVTRPDRLKELGRVEIDRETYNQTHPGNTMSRETFVKNHPQDYPVLSSPAYQHSNVPPSPSKDPVINRPVPQKPDVTTPQPPKPTYTPPSNPNKPPVYKNPPKATPPPVPKQQPPRQQPEPKQPPKSRPK